MIDRDFLAFGIDFGIETSSIKWQGSWHPQASLVSWGKSNVGADRYIVPSLIGYDTSGRRKFGYDVQPEDRPILRLPQLLLREDAIVKDAPKTQAGVGWVADLNRTAEEIVGAYLTYLWLRAVEEASKAIGTEVVAALPFQVVLTCSDLWPSYARTRLETAAQIAGILDLRTAGETTFEIRTETRLATHLPLITLHSDDELVAERSGNRSPPQSRHPTSSEILIHGADNTDNFSFMSRISTTSYGISVIEDFDPLCHKPEHAKFVPSIGREMVEQMDWALRVGDELSYDDSTIINCEMNISTAPPDNIFQITLLKSEAEIPPEHRDDTVEIAGVIKCKLDIPFSSLPFVDENSECRIFEFQIMLRLSGPLMKASAYRDGIYGEPLLVFHPVPLPSDGDFGSTLRATSTILWSDAGTIRLKKPKSILGLAISRMVSFVKGEKYVSDEEK